MGTVLPVSLSTTMEKALFNPPLHLRYFCRLERNNKFITMEAKKRSLYCQFSGNSRLSCTSDGGKQIEHSSSNKMAILTLCASQDELWVMGGQSETPGVLLNVRSLPSTMYERHKLTRCC
jgi:hypothetical protein